MSEICFAEWMGVPAAARYLQVAQRTLYRLIDEGQVVAFRLGRVIRLRREDLDAFVESCRIRPGELAHLYARGRTDGTNPT